MKSSSHGRETGSPPQNLHSRECWRSWAPSLPQDQKVRWTREVHFAGKMGCSFLSRSYFAQNSWKEIKGGASPPCKNNTVSTEGTRSTRRGWLIRLYTSGTFKLLAIYSCLAVKSHAFPQFTPPPPTLSRLLPQPWSLWSCWLNIQDLPIFVWWDHADVGTRDTQED